MRIIDVFKDFLGTHFACCIKHIRMSPKTWELEKFRKLLAILARSSALKGFRYLGNGMMRIILNQ